MNRRFEAALLAALLLFCVSCARIPANVIPRPTPGRNVQTADYVTHIISSRDWTMTRWYRVGDSYEIVGFFVVSQIGSICLDQNGTWAITQHGEPVECAGGWRAKSNSIGSTGSRVTR